MLRVSGRMRLRPEESVNSKLGTGAIEVVATALTVLNSIKGNLPFAVSVHDEDPPVREEVRLRQRNLALRHQVMQTARRFLDEH